MNKKELISIVKNLSDLPGAPGFEDEVSDYVANLASTYGDVSRDKMNNVYIDYKNNHFSIDSDPTERKQAKRLRVQLDAHIDEVAFMVSAIRDNGCLEFITLGRWINCNIPAHLFSVRNNLGEYITGLSASKPPHFSTEEEKNKMPSLEDLVIDIGCSSKSEVEAKGIRIGAPVVPTTKCQYFEDDELFIGKAFDCRAGCAAILGTLDKVNDINPKLDIVATFSSQEEVGTRGAKVTANRCNADLAIVFEGCPADDTFSAPYKIQTALRKGPMLRHIDARMVTHPGFQRYALNLAETNSIPVQSSVRSNGATNAAEIHLSGQAVPTIVIGIPVRYIHTSYGYMSLHDLESAISLASTILSDMDLEKFKDL